MISSGLIFKAACLSRCIHSCVSTIFPLYLFSRSEISLFSSISNSLGNG